MEKNKHLRNFSKASIEIGKKISYVQGGGGNTSVKFNESQMAIKASGVKLKDITHEQGFSVVDYSMLNQYLNNPDLNESLFAEKIHSFVVETDNRPSIETGFHSLLGTYVVHTHSAYVNVLNCSEEGKEEINKLFPEFIWVKYATPGRDVTLELKDNIPTPLAKEGCIFLQNHGLIVWADNSETVLKVHSEISNIIKDQFNLDDFIFNEERSYIPNSNKKEVLFPDQAVYTMASKDFISSIEAQETICSYDYIIKSIEKIGFTPSFLPEKEVNKLLDMEGEKYRQSLIK